MRTLIAAVSVTVALCLWAAPVTANPVNVYTFPDPVQDNWSIEGEWDEMGTGFPVDELLSSATICTTTYDPCPVEKETGVNYVVSITNLTLKAYEDVYYVADPETNLTNWDEWVGNAGIGVMDHQKAFRIDYLGANVPLISESITVNAIWEPQETWEFVIQDYTNTLGLAPHLFGSLGIASKSGGDTLSSGSILVPEPASLSLLALGALALIRRRRR